jgi:hypothetical protein
MTKFGQTTPCGQALLPLVSITCRVQNKFRFASLITAYSSRRSVGQRIALSFISRSIKMPLLNLVVALIVVGVALYLVNRYIPMASSIKSILNVVVVVAVGVFVLKAAGLWGEVTSFRIGR